MKINFENWFAVDKTNLLKFLMAYGIIFHHLSFQLKTLTFLRPFNYVGFLFCGVFFFISGYGLYINKTKNKSYFDSYSNRIKKLLLPFFISFVIYFMVKLIVGKNIAFNYNLLFTVNYCWYVYEQLIFYLLFYLLFRNEKKYSNLLLYIIVLIFVLVASNNLDNVWWKSSIAFPFGITFAKNRKLIFNYISNKYFLKEFLLFVSLFLILFIIKNVNNIYLISILYQFIVMIFCLLVCGILLLYKFKFSIRVNYSYELYLIHGLFIEYIPNINFLKIFVVLFCSTVGAIVLSWIDKKISKKFFE